MTHVTVAGTAAGVLIAIVAVFQAGLAAGAPWGAIAWGGAQAGRLPARLRRASAASAVFLVVVGAIVLARSGVLHTSLLPVDWLAPACWIIAGLLALNTLGNLASRSRVERFGFGGMTAALVVLVAYVALSGPGPG